MTDRIAPSSTHQAKPGFDRIDFLKHRWPTLLAVVVLALTFGDGTPPVRVIALILIIMPVIYLVFGALRGELRNRRMLLLQLGGLVGFAGLGLITFGIAPDVAKYPLAFGWLGHGMWDIAHHRAKRVVPQAYAEWCAVVDVIGAVAILILL